MNPSSPDKETLIAALGLTPQVITETLYYLTAVRRPPARISEIWAFTTAPGKAKLLCDLLDVERGQFYAFCHEYGIDPGAIRFNRDTIVVLTGPDGQPLEDIRTPEDNAGAADQVIALVQKLTEDPKVILHGSVAGGRKTMSLYLGYAFQFFGRPQDTLSHVLIRPPELEHPGTGFFYIPKTSRLVEVDDGQGGTKVMDMRDARIELAEIPYIRLRDRLRDLFGPGDVSYSTMVRSAQREIDSTPRLPELIIDRGERSVRIGKMTLSIAPLPLAIYICFARRRMEEPDGGWMRLDELLEGEGLAHLQTEYEAIYGGRPPYVSKDRLPYRVTADVRDRIAENLSKVNRMIREGLEDPVLELYYRIESRRRYGDTRYRIALNPEKIEIV